MARLRAVECRGFIQAVIEEAEQMSVPVSRGGRPGVRLKVPNRWAHGRGVTLDLSLPSKPTDNAFAGGFNGRFHDGCQDTHWFLSVEDARSKIEAWRRGTTTRAGLAVPWGT